MDNAHTVMLSILCDGSTYDQVVHQVPLDPRFADDNLLRMAVMQLGSGALQMVLDGLCQPLPAGGEVDQVTTTVTRLAGLIKLRGCLHPIRSGWRHGERVPVVYHG